MMIVTCALALALLTSPASSAPPDDYVQKLQAVADAKPDAARIFTLGKSRGGRDIRGIWLAAKGSGGASPADRPALVIVAGLNPMHRVGMDAAVGLAARLADNAALLDSASIYIIPCMNPDAVAWHERADHPKMDWSRSIEPHDADHDARTNEDGADDLNADGIITMMRVKNPAPSTGLRTEHFADAANANLLRKPDAAKGEKAEWALLVEGLDNDHDGKFNEDGVGGMGGGVDFSTNFPYRWPEFADGAGRFALCEPETRALIEWMLTTKNIAAVLVYGPGDTFINIPPTGRFDASGQVPLGIEEGDKAAYEEISKLFKDATGITAATALDNTGTLQGWAYAHYGVMSFQTPVWVRPDQIKKPEPPKEAPKDAPKEPENKDAKPAEPAAPAKPQHDDEDSDTHGPSAGDAMQPPAANQPPAGGGAGGAGGGRGGRGAGGAGRGGAGGSGGAGAAGAGAGARAAGGEAPAAGDDAAWFKYNDERIKAGDPSGFIDFKPFKHPQLGDVEIGGWKPGFRLNPPVSELDRLVGEQAKFVEALVAKFPRVVVEGAWVEPAGDGLWRITVRATNEGFLPTMPAIGVKARRALPTILTIDTPLARIISGERFTRAWSIAGLSGKVDATWLITAAAGETAKVSVRPTVGAPLTIDIKPDSKEGAR